MQCRTIDLDHYARREHFDYFKGLPYPYVGITTNVDASAVLHFSKQYNRSFYLSFLHAVALAADSVPELRQRIHGNQIIEYSECPTSHVELLEDRSYCYCTLFHHMPFDAYYDQAEKARAACRNNGIHEDENVESMYFISALPWVHYTALIQPVAGGEESNPRITWGKYEEMPDGKIEIPVSVLAHHALVDGIHIARFYDCLNAEIQKFDDMDPGTEETTGEINRDYTALKRKYGTTNP